jgi:hypothetical protein
MDLKRNSIVTIEIPESSHIEIISRYSYTPDEEIHQRGAIIAIDEAAVLTQYIFL